MKGIDREAAPVVPAESMEPVSSIPAGTETSISYVPTVDEVFEAAEKGVELHPAPGVITVMESGAKPVVPTLGMATLRRIGRSERSTRAPKPEGQKIGKPILSRIQEISEGLREYRTPAGA